jgi:hypothetical protein
MEYLMCVYLKQIIMKLQTLLTDILTFMMKNV